MKHLNYLMVITAFLMMNVMNAELKTFGMPSDAETEEAPAEEAPAEEAPAEEAPTEEAPAEEAPAEEAPAEEAPAEEDEMPSASEDSEVNADQPIKFKEEYILKANLGTTMPFGKNISPEFNSGLNINLAAITPFSFTLGAMTFNIAANFSTSTLTANASELGREIDDFGITTFGTSLATKISILDLDLKAGLASLSFTSLDTDEEDMSATVPYLGLNLGWKLPLPFDKISENLQDVSLTIYGGGTMILGGPTSVSSSSEILDFGISVGYPILF